jgi:hypothetical protein
MLWSYISLCSYYGINQNRIVEAELPSLDGQIHDARRAISAVKSLEKIGVEVEVSRTDWYGIETEDREGAWY